MSLTTSVAEKLPACYEIALVGRLDTETHTELERVAKELLAKDVRGLRLDLAKLNYISSMGLRVVLQLAKAMREKNGAFQVVNPQPQIRKVFEIAAALPSESLFVSTEEADRYYDAMQRKVLNKEIK